MIRNNKDGRVYVGESRNIERRWQFHLQHLSDGTHHNRHLQVAFDQGDITHFDFSILAADVFDRDERLRLECHWTDLKRAWLSEFGYNVDLRSEAMRDWIRAKEAAARASQQAERQGRLEQNARRFEGILREMVHELLAAGELSYEDRERLLELVEEIEQYGFSLPDDDQVAVDAVRMAKRTDRVRVSHGVEYRVLVTRQNVVTESPSFETAVQAEWNAKT